MGLTTGEFVNSHYVFRLEGWRFHPAQWPFSNHANNYDKGLTILSQPTELLACDGSGERKSQFSLEVQPPV